MKRLLMKSIALLLCVSMAACTSMRVVADGRDAVDTVERDAMHGLHAGEHLLVHTRDGEAQQLVYERTEGGELVGQAGGAGVRIAVSKVVRIERKENDGWKTAGLAAGITAVVLALAAAAANSLANDMSNALTHGKNK